MPLTKVLAGIIDHRSTQGLKRALGRMQENPEKRPEALLLANYAKLVALAECMAPKQIMTAGEADIKQVLELLEEAKTALPEAVRYSLVMRKAQNCKSLAYLGGGL